MGLVRLRIQNRVLFMMIQYCDKEIEKIQDHGKDADTHIAASMAGQRKAFGKVRQKLKSKIK